MLLFCLRRQAPMMNYGRQFILHSLQNAGLSLPRIENICLRNSKKFSSNGNIFHSTFIQRGTTVRTYYQPTRCFSAHHCVIIKSYGSTWYCGRTCLNVTCRTISGSSKAGSQKRRSILIYVSAIWIFMFGMAYAGVPLYRIFCQVSCVLVCPILTVLSRDMAILLHRANFEFKMATMAVILFEVISFVRSTVNSSM